MRNAILKDLALPAVTLLIITTIVATSAMSAQAVTSIQQAYDQANAGDTIRIQSATFNENLFLNRPIQVTFDGGYTDTTFTTKGGATVLGGMLTITDGTLIVNDFVIGEPTAVTTPPVISGVAVLPPEIHWTTDQPATSQVEYGTTTLYGSSISDLQLTTSHRLALSGLEISTTLLHSEYRETFSAFGSRLHVLSDNLPTIDLVQTSDDHVRCRVLRQENVLGQQKVVGYPVYFVREQGIWKLLGF